MAENGISQIEANNTPVQVETEKDSNIAFILAIDKTGLAAEKANIRPEGHLTIDTLLKLPDTLTFPKGITLITGPNGIGKSTIMKTLQMLSDSVGLHEVNQELFSHKNLTWEDAKQQTLEGIGTTDLDRKKLGMAPQIARHIDIKDGHENMSLAYNYNMTEMAGAAWELESQASNGYWRMDMKTGKAIFEKGQVSDDILGSTQQIVDGIYGRMKADLEMNPDRLKLLLIDEPTGNADTQRSFKTLKELATINQDTGNKGIFIVATNDFILAMNRHVPRLDLGHPERGVHMLSDYPLDPEIIQGLADMGYAPISSS